MMENRVQNFIQPDHIQEFFNDEETTGPSTLMKQWDIALQCRAQSSQAKALRSEGQCIGRDSFAYGLETAGLAGG